MADRDNDVEVRVGASIDDFKSKMGEVQSIFGKVAERWVALTAIVAGGPAFKEFIDHANQVNVEAAKMSRTLGITAEEAGVISAAVGDVAAELGAAGASAETYTGSFLKFNRMLRSSSDELKKMGVDVDALKNGQKTSNEVFQEALKIVGQYKPGIDQTQAAMKLFGRSVDDVQLLMKVNAEKIEETRLKMAALNRTITNEGIAAAREYRGAMNDVGDVLDGFKKTVGEGVMPLFTELANSLASFGPTLIEATQYAVSAFQEMWRNLAEAVSAAWAAISEVLAALTAGVIDTFGGDESIGAMEVFKNALSLVVAAFVAFRIGVETVANIVLTTLGLLKSGFTTFGNVVSAALRLDWAGMKAAIRQGQAESHRVLQEGVDKAVAIAVKGRADLEKALSGGAVVKAKGTAAGGPDGTGTKKFALEDKGAEAEAAALAAAKAALEKAQNAASLSLLQEYLRQGQAIYDDAYKQNLVTTKEYYDAKLAVELSGTDAALAAKRKELEATKKLEAGVTKPDQKIKFQAQEAALSGEINVLEAKRNDIVRANAAAYRDAEQQRIDSMENIRIATEQAESTSSISSERQALEQSVALRRTSAEESFVIQRSLEERSYAATVTALQAKAAAIRGTDAEIERARAQLNADAEAAEREHQQRMTAIDNDAERERMKYSLQAQASVQGSFKTMVESLLNGVTKLSDVFRNFARSVTEQFVSLISQKFTDRLFDVTGANKAIDSIVNFFVDGVGTMVTRWFGAEQAKTAAATAGAATRKGVAIAEATTKTTADAVTTAAVVTGQATQTAATVAGASVRTTTEVASAATSTSVSLGASIANIGAKAWEAAASVYASIAAIPFVGPFLAPAAAFAAGALVLGFVSNIASSEGGEYEVDKDRLNFVHKKETILPAPFAQGLRELVGKGGVTPLVSAADQIVSKLALNETTRSDTSTTMNKVAPNTEPVPADAAASFARAELEAGSQSQGKSSGGIAPLTSAINQVVSKLAMDAPERANGAAGRTAVGSVPNTEPVAADASASRVPGKADPGQLAKPPSDRVGGVGPSSMASWWSLPSNPLPQLQDRATAPASAVAAQAAAVNGAAAASQSARPVYQLVGESQGDFFIANRRKLLEVLNDSRRDMRKG